MRHLLSLLLFFTLAANTPAAELPKPLITGLKNPESVAIGPDGRIYVSVIGEFDKDGDGSVVVIKDGKAVPFCEGLDDPKGLVAFQQFLYVADKKQVLDDKDGSGARSLRQRFPTPPLPTTSPSMPRRHALRQRFRRPQQGRAIASTRRAPSSLVIDAKRLPAANTPNGSPWTVPPTSSSISARRTAPHQAVRRQLGKIADKLGSADGLLGSADSSPGLQSGLRHPAPPARADRRGRAPPRLLHGRSGRTRLSPT